MTEKTLHKDEKQDNATDDAAPFYGSCRFVFSLCSTACFLTVYMLRVNLSVAIVCMAKPVVEKTDHNVSLYAHPHPTLGSTTDRKIEWNDTSDDIYCKELEGTNIPLFEGEFEWSKTLQGHVLSSFFYGYMCTQIVGGWLSDRYGGKHLLGTAMLLSGIITLLSPVAARTSVYLFIALRAAMGLAMGVMYPAMACMLGRWAPPLERSKMGSIIYSGSTVGTILAMSASGLLCATHIDNGWPLIFYTNGVVAFIWCIAWYFLVFNSPAVHPRITQAEKEHIQVTIGASVLAKKVAVPWRHILTSPPVWAITIAHASSYFGYYTIMTCIPMYMRDVLKFDIRQNGLLSALPYLLLFLAILLVGHIADFIRGKGVISTTAVRKSFQTIAYIIPAGFTVGMSFMSCSERPWAVGMLTASMVFMSFGCGGWWVNHIDIAPRFAGVLYGISNTAAGIAGILAPTLVGTLTLHGSKEEWQRVFFITAAVYVFGAVIYLLFASGEEQPWNNYRSGDTNNLTMNASMMENELNQPKTKEKNDKDTRLSTV